MLRGEASPRDPGYHSRISEGGQGAWTAPLCIPASRYFCVGGISDVPFREGRWESRRLGSTIEDRLLVPHCLENRWAAGSRRIGAATQAALIEQAAGRFQ